MTAELTPAEHAEIADADAYWKQFPVTWDPQAEGETVRGIVSHRGEAKVRDPDTDGGFRWVPRLQIKTPNGILVTVFASQKRLLNALVKLRPRVGDPIFIRYLGEDKRSAPGMNPTQNFEVYVRDDVPKAK